MHRSLYFVGQRVALPILERWKCFWTIPDDPVNFRLQLILGKWEPETVAFFGKHLKAGMTVLDVGAHVGYYTRLFSQLVGPTGTVIAFEPHPVHFRYLQKNCERLENAILINKAAGNRAGIVTLWDALPESGSASIALHETRRSYLRTKISKEIASRSRGGLPVKKFSVEMVALDEFLGTMDINSSVDVVKIDIEGAEVLAFQGAEKLLRSSKGFIVFEFSPEHLRDMGSSPRELLKLLQEYGYTKIAALQGDEIQILNISNFSWDEHQLDATFSYENCVVWKEV